MDGMDAIMNEDATTEYPLTLDSMPKNFVNEPPAGSMAPPTASIFRQDATVIINREFPLFNPAPVPTTALDECGQKYPQTLEEFKCIQAEQLEVFAKKMLDYSPANILLGGSIDVEADRLGALRGIVIRMNDKMNRLLNIIVRGNSAHNESAFDSFLDCSIYSIIAQIVDRRTWGK
jgi:hypothetical protein